jgi:hypothetical protein
VKNIAEQAILNLHDKYSTTLKDIEHKRDSESMKLTQFLKELGYE